MSSKHSPDSQERQTKLLTDSELEDMLGVGKGWAAKDRCQSARIPHVKIGRSVRYRIQDVEAFIEASVRKSTSNAAAA